MFRRKKSSTHDNFGSSELPGIHQQPGAASARYLLRSEPLPRSKLVRALEFRGSWRNVLDAIVAPITLFWLAVLVRAPGLADPPHIVFDEIHFVGFALSYLTGQYHFDIHPHLGKMIYAFVGYLAGIHPDPLVRLSNSSREALFHDSSYIHLRATALVFGSLHSPLMYLLVRSLNATRLVGFVAALMPLLDNMGIIESRYILLNGQLVAWTAAAFFCAVNLWSAPKNTTERWAWLTATAVTGTAAALTKFTAGVGPVVIAVISLTGLYPISSMPLRGGSLKRSAGRLSPIECITAASIAGLLYVACFALHFHLLPRTGDGEAFMRDEYKAGLLGSNYYNPKAVLPGFVETFIYLHYAMITRSAAISNPHPWETHWYEWITNSRGLLYHRSSAKNGKHGMVYLLVNPFISCTILAAVVILGVVCLARAGLSLSVTGKPLMSKKIAQEPGADKSPVDYFKRYTTLGCCFALGYALNLLPYIPVKRPAFNYHYMPSVFYGEVLTAISLDSLPRWRQRWAASAFVAFGTLTAFWYWSPWIYGTPTSSDIQQRLRWLPRWN